MTMKRPYQITAVVLFMLAGLFIREALKLKLVSSVGPGPGYLPFWVSVLVALLSVVMFVQATFKPQDPMPADFMPKGRGWLSPLAILGSLVASTLLMEVVGFRLISLAVYVFLLAVLGRQKPLVTVLVSLAGSWGVYYLFNDLLMVPLPVGIFGF